MKSEFKFVFLLFLLQIVILADQLLKPPFSNSTLSTSNLIPPGAGPNSHGFENVNPPIFPPKSKSPRNRPVKSPNLQCKFHFLKVTNKTFFYQAWENGWRSIIMQKDNLTITECRQPRSAGLSLKR